MVIGDLERLLHVRAVVKAVRTGFSAHSHNLVQSVNWAISQLTYALTNRPIDFLLCRKAAVDGEDRAGDELGFVGCKVECGLGYLIGSAHASHRLPGIQFCLRL